MRIFSLLLFLLSSLPILAQFNASNSTSRRALVLYTINSKGFYDRETEQMVDWVYNIEDKYAYDKSAHILYVLSYNANVAVTLTNDYAKLIKKDKSIPKLKGEELNKLIAEYSKKLDEKYIKLNQKRKQFIEDSIAKAKADSIKRIRAYEKDMAERKQKEDNYRATHDYHWVPIGDKSLSCTLCDHSFTEDSLYCYGITNDSIYFATNVTGDLGINRIEYHSAKIPSDLLWDEAFTYHYEIFKDSLTRDSLNYTIVTDVLNWRASNNYLHRIQNCAPYGYFDGWGWDDEYSMLTFHFNYVNTNPKTIRYITVYFKITNDVGDVRQTGYFKGTGPLKQWESANWSWDNSMYFVSGDASNMNITKVVLTWMNGKTQVVSGKYLQFNSSDDD
jgi:hypothetical protein